MGSIARLNHFWQEIGRAGAVSACAASLLLALAPGTANAQTFQTIPTTTTLWAGTQDFAADGLASVTFPGSGVILTGTAISTITGKPIRFLWYGDTSNGFCRMDPEVDAVLPPVNGIGGHQNNILTCIGAIQAAAFTPGQVAFDGSTNTIYVPDTGRTTAGVIRMHYNPAGDNGKGSLDAVSVRSLIGTTQNRNAAGGCPQVKDPKTGSLVPIVPNSAAIGPDGNLYVGSIRDGALIRIISPATFDPSTQCPGNGGVGVTPGPNDKIQIPILSADERVGVGHTFGLGWIGNTLLGADNIAPWVLFNADQCLTPVNGNRICGAPAIGGAAPMPTEILAAFVPGPQAGAATDAQFPNFSGNTFFAASFPSVTKISNITSTTAMTVQTSYGGAFSFISGLTPDPQDLLNKTLYVGVDPTQGSINGAASIWQVVEGAPAQPGPPLPPASVTATANSVVGAATGSVTVTWIPQTNGQPITSYVVQTFLAPATPGLQPTPSTIPNVTILPNASGVLPTTTTITGLTFGVAYQFAVEACNASGCSPLSAFSPVATPVAVTPPPAPVNVVGLAGNTQAAVAWVQNGTGGSPITSSTISTFNSPAGTLVGTTNVTGSATGGTVTALTNGNCYTFSVHATNAAGNSAESTPSAAVCLPIPVGVDQAIAMTAPATINAGSILTYTIKVTNNGPANVVQSLVSDTLPAPLSSFTATQGVCLGTVGGTAFSCNLGALNAGLSATVTVSVALPSAFTGPITNTATVSAQDALGAAVTDLNPANNSASASTTVGGGGGTCTATTTDVQVVGSAQNGGPAVNSGDTLTWQVHNNLGTTPANCVVFTSTLPANFVLGTVAGTGCSNVGNAITCNLGTIGGGATSIVTVNFNVGPTAGSFPTTGSATFTGTDTNQANNSSTVTIQPK